MEFRECIGLYQFLDLNTFSNAKIGVILGKSDSDTLSKCQYKIKERNNKLSNNEIKINFVNMPEIVFRISQIFN